MALTHTFKGIQDQCLQVAGMSGTGKRDLVKIHINEAGYEIWRRFEWHERKAVAWVNTVTPYETGTVTTTLDSATLTGSGTTWVAGHVGRKFALSASDKWFAISAFTSTTDLTMERNWPDATSAGDSYIIYDDVVNLASDMDVLLVNKVTLHAQDGGLLSRMSQAEAKEMFHIPTGTGQPTRFALIEEDSAGVRQMRLGPVAPDAVYVIRYPYLKTFTELTSDGDVPVIPVERRELLVSGTLKRIYALPMFQGSGRRETEEAVFSNMLRAQISDARAEKPRTVQLAVPGDTIGTRGFRFATPVDDS